MRVLIVDDEPLARDGVSIRLKRFPDLEVVGECGDGSSAVQKILDLTPDLVFLDVQMPGLDGFDVLRALPIERLPSVIFLTAYEKYALDAFDVHALDYVLKPIDDERFDRAVNRARNHAYTTSQRLLVQHMLDVLDHRSTKYLNRFTVKNGRRIQVVQVEDIELITAAGDYAELHTHGHVHLLRESLTVLEQRLDPILFIRIHRSRIIRADRIRELQPLENGDYMVTLLDGSQHRASRNYADRLHHWLRPDGI